MERNSLKKKQQLSLNLDSPRNKEKKLQQQIS